MKISVITAVFNNVDTIAEAVESVISQSHADLEYIVVDGGSTDGTMEVLRNYLDRIDIIVSGPDKGIYDALNKGIGLASGDVVGFLHSDDVLANADVLKRIAAAFEEHDVDATYGDLVYIRRESSRSRSRTVRYWRAGHFLRWKLKMGWMPPHPTVYLKRDVYGKAGTFDQSFRISADYDLMLRVLKDSRFRTSYIPEVLVKMRLGGASNKSLKNVLAKSREDIAALRKNGVGGFSTLVMKNLSKLPQFIRRSRT